MRKLYKFKEIIMNFYGAVQSSRRQKACCCEGNSRSKDSSLPLLCQEKIFNKSVVVVVTLMAAVGFAYDGDMRDTRGLKRLTAQLQSRKATLLSTHGELRAALQSLQIQEVNTRKFWRKP